MAFDPDHEHGHAHGTGVKWLDIIVGLSAMFISVVSLVVSIEHGKTMEKMVEQNAKMVTANTIPMLTYSGSMIDPVNSTPKFTLDIRNGGVGPAIIEWFEIRYKGASQDGLGSLIRGCCLAQAKAAPPPANSVFYSNLTGTILPARDTVHPITATDKAPPALFSALVKARADMDLRACYCSVLDECWLTDFSPGRAKRVKSCAVPAGVKTW